MKIMHAIYRPFNADSGGATYENSAEEKNAASFGGALPLGVAGRCSKPITNQGKYKHLKYGKSNIGKTGCIPIAIYNVMVLSDMAGSCGQNAEPMSMGSCGQNAEGDAGELGVPDFNDIVERVQSLKAPLFGGRMGTDPYMIDEILRGYGIENKEITDRRALAEEMAEAHKGTLFLITQWNDMRRPLKGIHAYVAEKHGPDRWACYNLVYRDYPTKAAGLAEMLGRGRLIVANRIEY